MRYHLDARESNFNFGVKLGEREKESCGENHKSFDNFKLIVPPTKIKINSILDFSIDFKYNYKSYSLITYIHRSCLRIYFRI